MEPHYENQRNADRISWEITYSTYRGLKGAVTNNTCLIIIVRDRVENGHVKMYLPFFKLCKISVYLFSAIFAYFICL